MIKMDQTAIINKQFWEQKVQEQDNFTQPWLTLDREFLRQCARGELETIPDLLRDDGALEFRHYLSDIFNGLTEHGLSIQQVTEAPRFLQNTAEAKPGSWEHWLKYITSFAIVAEKK